MYQLTTMANLYLYIVFIDFGIGAGQCSYEQHWLELWWIVGIIGRVWQVMVQCMEE